MISRSTYRPPATMGAKTCRAQTQSEEVPWPEELTIQLEPRERKRQQECWESGCSKIGFVGQE